MPASTKTTPAPARSYGGLALEDRVAARRARFIEAGTELFGTQGFRGATVRDPRFARIVLLEVLGVSAAIDTLYEESVRAMAELTIAPLAATQPALKLSRVRRELLGRALVGAGLQVAKMWMTGGYRLPRRDVVRTCVLVATGTLSALRVEAEKAAAAQP